MLDVGLSTCGFDLTRENFDALRKSGIKHIELSVPYTVYPELDHKKIGRDAESADLNIWSYHLPFNNAKTFDIASLDEDMRLFTVKELSSYIKKGAEIGIDKFIIHPCGEPKSSVGEERREEMKRAKESLNTLAEIAFKEGAVLLVEDLPRSCLGNTVSEITELVSANDKLRVCFDTNHLLTESYLDFIEIHKDKIASVHVSDFDGINERHWLPGEGIIEWDKLYSKLISIGYCGPWLYEISLLPNVRTIARRPLEFSDFYNNAMEIFEGKRPTPIGIPHENLGMWGIK